jgi:hypothetical protein
MEAMEAKQAIEAVCQFPAYSRTVSIACFASIA